MSPQQESHGVRLAKNLISGWTACPTRASLSLRFLGLSAFQYKRTIFIEFLAAALHLGRSPTPETFKIDLMDSFSSHPIADQLLADLRQESQLVSLMIRGYIEYRWAIGQEEREIAQAMIYNAFETYAIARGMPLRQAEVFCEAHLDQLIQTLGTLL